MIESVLKSVFGDGKGKGQPEGGAIPVDRPDAILAMMTTTFPGRSVVRKKKP